MRRFNGPAFGDNQGKILSSSIIEMALIHKLQILKDINPGLIPAGVEIYEDFGISRSFWCGATSTAHVRGVKDKHVDMINRWRTFKNALGKRPTLSMHDHYSDIEELKTSIIV
jgi:hypothetical protein